MVRLSTSPREMEPDVAALKVADLKVALRSRGLSVAGRKAELAARLRAALADKENDEAVDCAPPKKESAAAARAPLAPRNENRPPVPLFAEAAKLDRDRSAAGAPCHSIGVCVSRGARDADEHRGQDTELHSLEPEQEPEQEQEQEKEKEPADERLQAMEEAMEETLAEMEVLDAQLAASNQRTKRLEDELCRAREEAAHVWGASQKLRARAETFAAELRSERTARQNVERLLRTASEEQGAWAQAMVFVTRVVGAAVGVAVVMADYRSASLLDMM